MAEIERKRAFHRGVLEKDIAFLVKPNGIVSYTVHLANSYLHPPNNK